MNFKSILLAFIILMLIVVPASADFSANFNDFSLAGWTVNSGSFSAASGYLVGTGIGPANIITSPSIGTGQDDIKFDHYFCDAGSCATSVSLNWSGTARGLELHTTPGITGIGFSITPISGMSLSTSYTIHAQRVGGNIRIRVYTVGTTTLAPGVVNNDQTVPYTYAETDNIQIKISKAAGTISERFDNIVTTSAKFSVSGHVYEGVTTPINGATVSYSGGSTTTNALGDWSFTSVVNGTYSFTASKTGFVSSSQSIAVNSDLVNQNFILTNTSQATTFINFNKDVYVINEQANVTYGINDADWILGYVAPYVISICDSEAVMHTDCYNTDATSNNDSFPFLMAKTTTYTANMGRVLGGAIGYDLGLGFILIVASDTALVTGKTKPTLQVNATVTANSYADVHYNVGHGYTEGDVSVCPFILNDAGEYVREGRCEVLNGNVSGWAKVPIGYPGTYQLQMYDCTGDCFYAATTYTKAIFKPPDFGFNVSTSDIRFTDGVENYSYGDVMHIDYQVDDTNWTSYRIYLDVHNYDRNITGAFEDLNEIYYQSATNLPWTITNRPGTPLHIAQIFYYGNNTLRLRGENSTTQITIDYMNFTLSSTNQWGYNIILSGQCDGNVVYTGQTCTIQFVIPSPSRAIISKSGSTTGIIFNQSLNHTTTVNKIFTVPGIYDIMVYDSSEVRIMAFQSLNVKQGNVTQPTGAAPTANDIVNLIDSNIFWSFIVTAGLMILIAFKTSQNGSNPVMPTSIVGVMSLGVFTFVGMFPQWIFWGIILIAAVTFAWARARDINTGGGA